MLLRNLVLAEMLLHLIEMHIPWFWPYSKPALIKGWEDHTVITRQVGNNWYWILIALVACNEIMDKGHHHAKISSEDEGCTLEMVIYFFPTFPFDS